MPTRHLTKEELDKLVDDLAEAKVKAKQKGQAGGNPAEVAADLYDKGYRSKDFDPTGRLQSRVSELATNAFHEQMINVGNADVMDAFERYPLDFRRTVVGFLDMRSRGEIGIMEDPDKFFSKPLSERIGTFPILMLIAVLLFSAYVITNPGLQQGLELWASTLTGQLELGAIAIGVLLVGLYLRNRMKR